MKPVSVARVVGLSLVLVASVASAQQDEDRPIRRHTSVGTAVLIRAHAEWNASCETRQAPRIEIVDAPEHGHIDLRPGEAQLGANYVGSTSCVGRVGRGIQVIYQPDASFSGTDRVTYKVQYTQGGGRVVHARIVVE